LWRTAFNLGSPLCIAEIAFKRGWQYHFTSPDPHCLIDCLPPGASTHVGQQIFSGF
jgi:hypothetical protein